MAWFQIWLAIDYLTQSGNTSLLCSRPPALILFGNDEPLKENPMNPLRCRNLEGNTPFAENWGANSEYGTLRDVLLGPADNYHWLPTSSISKATLKRGDSFDK